MNTAINTFAQTANSLFTMFCGVTIIYLISRGKLERHLFYYGWSFGFILYGIQILFRLLQLNKFLYLTPMLIAFILFPISTYTLNPRKYIALAFVPFFLLYILLASLVILGVLQLNKFMWIIGSIFFYTPVAVMIIAHRKVFGNCVDKLIIGWLSIFILNILFPLGGYISDTLVIFSKAIIFAGILSYDFAIITKKIRDELASPIRPITTGFGEEGGLRLVMFRTGTQSPLTAVSKWVNNKVEENVEKNIETIIMVLQDAVSYDILRSAIWKKPELVHVFIFSQNTISHEEFTTLRFDIIDVGATITEVARKHSRSESKGMIILVNLSILIHTLGSHRVYSLLLNKMGILRSSGTSLIAVFHPETHEEWVVALFESIADNIIQE